MTSRSACDGRLIPWADPVTGMLGWRVHTASRRLAAAAAGNSGVVQSHGKREWRVRIPQSALTVTVISADDSALRCRLDDRPGSGALTVTFTPWTVSAVLKCLPGSLPTRGTLSVCDVQVKTRMGRIVRYLIPEFIPSQRKSS